MTKAVIHVGSEKCASSYVEFFFDQAEIRQGLVARGIVSEPDITRALRRHGNHDAWDEAAHGAIRDQYFAPRRDADDGGCLFFSEEALLGLRHDPGQDNNCEQRCQLIQRLAEGLDTHVIIIVRRQDTFLESLYSMLVRRSETRHFDEFLEEFPLDNLRWDTIADTFAGVFGRDHVTVLPLESKVLKSVSDTATNVIESVMEVMGVVADVNYGGTRYNSSIAAHMLDVKRYANTVLTEEQAHAFGDLLVDHYPKDPKADAGLLSDEQRSDVLAHYRAGNEQLFAEYFKGADPAPYLSAA